MADTGCSLRTHGWHVDVAVNVSVNCFKLLVITCKFYLLCLYLLEALSYTVTATATVSFSQAGRVRVSPQFTAMKKASC